MQGFLIRIFLSIAVAITWVPIAPACIWDRMTIFAEREFKSNYLDKTLEESTPPLHDHSPSSADWLIVGGIMGGGMILLLGALTLSRSKSS